MQPISNLFGQRAVPPKKTSPTRKRPQPKNPRWEERRELIKFFMDEVNKERVASGKYEPLPFVYFQGKVAHIEELFDLYYLKRICEEAKAQGKSFGKKFHWEIKPRQPDTPLQP
jgi:hypothetical protein